MKRILVISLALVAVTACGGTISRHTGEDVEQISKEVDSVVSQSVRRTIFGDTTMSGDAQNIFVQTHNGTVTVRGAVVNDQERERILQMVRGISGVRDINDELKVSSAPVDMPPVADAYRTH